MENEEESKAKLSSKGVSQQQNKHTWERYKEVLNGAADKATNQGFQMAKGMICTYTQNKLGLIAYYDKQWMLLDRIHTEPIEYHLLEQAALHTQTPGSGRLADNTQLARWASQGEARHYRLSKTRWVQWPTAVCLPAHLADTANGHLHSCHFFRQGATRQSQALQ